MISFLICSHKAPPGLKATLVSIAQQIKAEPFEVVLVNNGFDETVEEEIRKFAVQLGLDLRLARENTPGLGHARKLGFQIARGGWIVMLDDDNTIGPEFLSNLFSRVSIYKTIGGITPCIEPVWEATPPNWVLAVGPLCLSYNSTSIFPRRPFECLYRVNQFREAPVAPGGGMIIARRIAEDYLRVIDDSVRLALERTGESLTGGQDYDIWSQIQRSGMDVLVTDALDVFHHIPMERLSKRYLFRLNYGITKSYMLMLRVLGEVATTTFGPALKALLQDLRQLARDYRASTDCRSPWTWAILILRQVAAAHGKIARLPGPQK